jgi:nucleoside-diphosphate-sugar epimerase
MKCLVTGTAGFIGSHLSKRLIQAGYSLIGIDSFTDHYPKKLKEMNLAPLLKESHFTFIPEDINDLNIGSVLEGVDFVLHLAAQAGVRASWGKNFSVYTENNIQATQRLLEAAKDSQVIKFVFASSSSVYGLCPELPMKETSQLKPFSPYGVSKLAAELLCSLYFKNYGVPTVSLRYFTVYGPGQRPDMAFHKFFRSIIEKKPVVIFGDGSQTRDFTYIDDVVEATYSAMTKGKAGEIYNIGGGNQRILKQVLPEIAKITGSKVPIRWGENQKGDVLHTHASIEKAAEEIDFAPKIQLEDGLKEEWNWIQNIYSG